MPPPDDRRHGNERSNHGSRSIRSDGGDEFREYVISRRLIRPEDQPSFGPLGVDLRQCLRQDLRRDRTKAKEDRTRGVGSDHQAPSFGIGAENELGMASCDRSDVFPVDFPRFVDPIGIPVGDQLVRGVPRWPSDGRGRADQSPEGARVPDERLCLRQHFSHVPNGNDGPHRAPVEGRRWSMFAGHEGGIGSGFPLSGRGANRLPRGPSQPLHVIAIQRRSSRVHANGAFREFANARRVTPPAPKSSGKRRVPPSFPRDVGVQPNQAGKSDQVSALAMGRANDFSKGVSGAASPRAIRVVDANENRLTRPADSERPSSCVAVCVVAEGPRQRRPPPRTPRR
jgi:hypothetical protein